VRRWSLTDLSIAQQILQATMRTLVIAAAAIALARPTWVTRDSKVATVVLVDVSESVSDKQLGRRGATSTSWRSRQGRRLDQGGDLRREAAGRGAQGGAGSSRATPPAPAKGGAGTDVQAAIQLAYGLYPPGHLPRMMVVTDGNQTRGDLVSEAYRAKEMGVRLSWRTFAEDQVQEIRVVGLHLPDEIKVGQPFEIMAEVWSTHAETVTLALRQDEFRQRAEPSKTVELQEGVNRIPWKSEAKRAGATTYRLRLSKYAHDTEKANNEAVMTAPVKGKPSVLYVEGGVLREPGSAGYLQRALEHENIDVEVRGPRGLPGHRQGAREVRPGAGVRRAGALRRRRPDGRARSVRLAASAAA
jgi:Ca-activated chloride channel family protein